MKKQDYIRPISTTANPSATCYCCGSFILMSDKDTGFCHFCEAYNLLDENIPENSLSDKFYAIQMLIESNDPAEAEKTLDKILKYAEVQQNPAALFGAASIYRNLADAYYYNLDYNRHGFMEENSSNIYHSLDLTSKYKTLFYKLIRMAEPNLEMPSDSNLIYLAFFSCLKLKNYHKAKKFLNALSRISKGLEVEYAEIAFEVDSGNGIKPEKIFNMVSKGNSNSLYYLAKNNVKLKRFKEAKSILERLNSRVNMPDSRYLLLKIEKFMKETEL
jgi:hypothetical protein